MKQMLKSILAKKVFKSFSIYTGANFINQAIPFFLLPVFTRLLTPEDYGMLATFMAIMSITNVIISMGNIDAVARGYYDRGKKDFDFSSFIFNTIFINLVVFLFLLFILIFVKLTSLFDFIIPYKYLFLIPMIGFCAAVYNIPLKMFVIKQKPLPYAALEISGTFVEMGLSIYLIVITGLTWKGRVIGITFDKVLFFLLGVYFLKKCYSIKISFNYDYIKRILTYGIPVVFHSLGFTVIAAVDRFFLNRYAGLSITGVYSVSYSIAAVVGFIAGAFNSAWNPILYEKLGNLTEKTKLKLVRVTYIYFILIFLFAFLLIFAAPYVLKIFIGKNFYGAIKFIFWIALAYAVHGMYTMVVNYIFYEKKTYLLSWIAGVTVILSIIFNYTFIKMNGAIGAAQATFLVFLCRFLLVWYYSNKVCPMPWFSFAKIKN